jgi:imidazoleglycerol phosphate synthase cyclase subunit
MNPLRRLIPVLLLKDGLISRATQFRTHQIVGSPLITVRRLSQWNVDELVILNISDGEDQDLRRDDLQHRYLSSTMVNLLRQVAQHCSMPVTFGGRIKTVEDVRELLGAGADKCVINTQAFMTPGLITEVAKRFGSQCMIVGIDVKEHAGGKREVYLQKGTQPTGADPIAWAKEAERLGAGEIFLNSIDRDGMGTGYDIELLREMTRAVALPVVACGGVGDYEHFAQGILEGHAHAVAAANIFHFRELSYIHAKDACIAKGVNMRPASSGSSWAPAEPQYDLGERDERIRARLEQSSSPLPASTPAPSKHVR